jgi:1,4-alpha-glucan branching enzyme
MDKFAQVLAGSSGGKVVYHEDHDDAGNAGNTERTMVTAVRGAPLVDATRRYAEARCRCVAGLSLLSAGTPMFLMGEEVATANQLPFRDFLPHRIDFAAERTGNGAHMFAFYQAILRLRLSNDALRSRQLDIVHVHNDNRILAFLRTSGASQSLVVASLANQAYRDGYSIAHSAIQDGGWCEIFNSDAAVYGGDNVGNYGLTLPAANSRIIVVVPADGFVVLERR